MLVWSKSAIRTSERYQAVFIFNFEHIQQIDLILLLLLEHVSWAQDKIHKTT